MVLFCVNEADSWQADNGDGTYSASYTPTVAGTDLVTITLDGASLTAGNAIDSPGTAGDFVCLLAVDATNWLVLGKSGTWIDGGTD